MPCLSLKMVPKAWAKTGCHRPGSMGAPLAEKGRALTEVMPGSNHIGRFDKRCVVVNQLHLTFLQKEDLLGHITGKKQIFERDSFDQS